MAQAQAMERSGTSDLVAGLAALAYAMQGGRGCLLTFHRAAPGNVWADLPDRNFYLNLDFLDQLLAYLKRGGWSIVTIEEMLAATPREGRRLVNFSVDDCYRDTHEHVVPLFRHHGAAVTLFVTTGIPDGTLPLAWSGLEAIIAMRDEVRFGEDLIDTRTPEDKRAAYGKLWTAIEAAGTDAAYEQLCRQNDVDAAAVRREHAITWDMLAGHVGDPLVEIGAHTISHARIASLAPDAARAEIAGSRERIKTRLGVDARHFAFPYGRKADCGPRDFDLVEEAGYSSGSTTRKGILRSRKDRFQLPRNTLNGGHQATSLVAASLSGLSGVAARVLGRV